MVRFFFGSNSWLGMAGLNKNRLMEFRAARMWRVTIMRLAEASLHEGYIY